MVKTYTMDLAGRQLKVEVGKMAELTNGTALVSYGETTILAAAVASDKPKDGTDFFPLSVNYEEKTYAVGKIPGGFLKREGRPSDKAVLTSRVIDRPIRPLFPKDYRNDVVITTTVMSVDQDCSPEITAMIGAALVTDISDIPFNGPVGSVQVGLIDGEIVINPTTKQREHSKLSLIVSSSRDKVMMIEAGADEVPEDIMLEAIMKGHEVNQQIVEFIASVKEDCGKPKKDEYETHSIPSEVYDKVAELIGYDRMVEAVFTPDKLARGARLEALMQELKKVFEDTDNYGEEYLKYSDEAFYKFEKYTVRNMILREHKRPDGRRLDELRKLSAEVDLIPRVHGSGMFTRGQTQVLTIATLAPISEAQIIDGLDELEVSKRYMHHYNFPPFSVGEARPPRPAGRREVGHGALAERALVPVIPPEEEFPYAIRLVSEVLSSNGSTSQASICGSTLALMAAGVPIKSPVAGISVGLVTGETTDDFVLLTDIQGLEDYLGDMDFKVGGTKNGITSIQMDMKIDGLTKDIIKQALRQTKQAIDYIIDDIMLKAIEKPRESLSPYAPYITQITVNPEKISEIIGQKGKTINKIIEETGAKIDIEDDGRISVCAENEETAKRTIEIIEGIARDLEAGQIFLGKVVKIIKIGAFVQLAPGKEGLVHISQIAHNRVENVEDVLKVGDMIEVKITEIDKQGRVNLSRKALLPK
ncbi:MAG: polyribonucleotide nucleotidyltransferase [Epulopiscium sp. Nuni2H_MBin003]|nr:MAG: polyribonucleotide nucleotidyltransferase [Epulopiscium sp. Nuni2H_MBin003]